MSEQRLLTVAVCTFNRAAILRDTLDHLARARIPPGWQVEFLVIDNASTDDTDQLVRAARLPRPPRLLRCPIQGLSHARNMAVAHARGEAIVWLDDDVRPDPGILEAYVAALDQYPDRALFGGPVEPYFENDPPAWVRTLLPQLQGVFSLRAEFPPDEPFQRGRFPAGANMMCRIGVHRQIVFETRLGRVGASGLGEDSLLLEDAMKLGFRGAWVPAARLEHFVPVSRQTTRYVSDWYASLAVTHQIMNRSTAKASSRILGMPRWALREWLEGLTRYAIYRLLAGPESWFPALRAAGYVRGVLRYHFRAPRT